MTRLDISLDSLTSFDAVRHPPVTNPIGIVLMYRSTVEVETDLLVADALGWDWVLSSAEHGGLGV